MAEAGKHRGEVRLPLDMEGELAKVLAHTHDNTAMKNPSTHEFRADMAMRYGHYAARKVMLFLHNLSQLRCSGGAEVGVDWVNGLVLHEGDPEWHSWDSSIYGERPSTDNKDDGGE